jgi:hypothetical protein
MIKNRVNQIKGQMEATTSDYDKKITGTFS